MILTSFDGFTFPLNQANSDVGITALTDYLTPTGAPDGAFDLYGDQSPFGNQTYRHDFMFPTLAAAIAGLDVLRGKAGKRATLIQTMPDASMRQATAKLVSAKPAMNVEDAAAGITRVSCEFNAYPFWYATTPTTVSFTTATSVNLTSANGNLGNQRAIRYVVLTLTTSITASIGSPFIITITPTTGTTAVFQLTANMTQPIIINAGTQTITANAVNQYANTARAGTQQALLFIEPGDSVLSFNAAVSGSIVFRSVWK